MVVSIGSSTYFYRLDTHTWKQPRENSRTHYVTHTLRTRTGYAHMETQLYTPNLKYPSITVLYLKEELCDMRYVIRTAISHGHIK